jgi:hypothetical protein
MPKEKKIEMNVTPRLEPVNARYSYRTDVDLFRVISAFDHGYKSQCPWALKIAPPIATFKVLLRVVVGWPPEKPLFFESSLFVATRPPQSRCGRRYASTMALRRRINNFKLSRSANHRSSATFTLPTI